MKTKLILASLMVSCSLFAQAQEKSQATFNHDIGFNTNIILNGIFNSGSTPFSLMYKKYTAENKACRFGANVFLQSNNSSADSLLTGNSLFESSAYNLALIFGKEKQNMLSGKWIWYYGGDLLPSYRYSYTKTESQTGFGLQENSNTSNSVGLSVRPFIGIRFNISSRLYISTESSFNIGYAYTVNNQKIHNPDLTDQDAKQKTTNTNLFAALSPATSILFFYRF